MLSTAPKGHYRVPETAPSILRRHKDMNPKEYLGYIELHFRIHNAKHPHVAKRVAKLASLNDLVLSSPGRAPLCPRVLYALLVDLTYGCGTGQLR